MATSKRPPVFRKLPVVYSWEMAWSREPCPSWTPEGRLVLVELLVPARFTVW